MKNLALLLIFAFMTWSFGDDNDGRFREWSKRLDLKGRDEMHFRKQDRSEFVENSKIFDDSSELEGDIRKKMVEKAVDGPTGLAVDEPKEEEMLEDLKERVARAFERNALETLPKIFSLHRKANALSKRSPSTHVSTAEIPTDMNLHQVKDFLEGGMGFSCDDGKEEGGPAAELEGELLEHVAVGETRCMPKKAIYRDTLHDISDKPASHPQQRRTEFKDVNLQHLHHMFHEMLGLPCHEEQENSMNVWANGPVVYTGVAKMRRIRGNYGKHPKSSDDLKKASCIPPQRLHKTSDVDVKQLSQFLDGMKRFPCYDKEKGEIKPNELEMKLFKYCSVGKMYRVPESSGQNHIENVPFNKTSFGAEQNVQYRKDLDLENINYLLEEAMKFVGEKFKITGQKVHDLHDWFYRLCGFIKFRRLSLNSIPHRKINDASQKTSCSPLEGSEEPKRKVLRQLDSFLDEMLGFNCEGKGEEEMNENTAKSRLYQYCGIMKVHLLPEGYFVNPNASNFNKTASCGTPQSPKDPMDLSLKQVIDILEESVGLPKRGVIAEMGEGLYIVCTIVKFQLLPEPLDFH